MFRNNKVSMCPDNNIVRNKNNIAQHPIIEKSSSSSSNYDVDCDSDSTSYMKDIMRDIDIIKTSEEEIIFDPYNPLNKEITVNHIQSILTRYGIPGKVHNVNLYKRAFVHKSYVKRPFLDNLQNNITIAHKPDNCISLKTKSNERLEFLGDGVLECITKYYLYRRFPKENEGFMTDKKIAIVKNEHIGRLAYEMGLHKWSIMSKHAEEKNIRTNLKKLGCLFEAFLGALFLDFNKISIHDEEHWFDNVFVTGPGFQMAQIFIESIFEKHINWTKLIKEDDNYKNILQVKIQKEFKTTPTYLIIEHDDNGYNMGVYLCVNIPIEDINHNNSEIDNLSYDNLQERLDIRGNLFILLGSSIHKIKKKAEQLACYMAIERINRDNNIITG
jgi:dsRNA-specific ribonuclease